MDSVDQLNQCLSWAVLRKAYPRHAATWFHAANAHIKAEELEQAEVLLTHAQQQFPNHPNNLIDRATLAMCRQQMMC
jgi:Tfp pilus assembly protein PilF